MSPCSTVEFVLSGASLLSSSSLFTRTTAPRCFVNVSSPASSAVASTDVHAKTSRLEQNYPNPFNPATTINYQLSTINHATLRIYDMLGREVAILVNEAKAPGSYRVTWDATGMASGVYLARLQAGVSVDVKKIVLMK